jgi:lysophospholipase L1-like esterase
MIECLILGDSIAQGVKQYRPECVLQAKQGISSHRYNKRWPQTVTANSVIISLGSNDTDHIRTLWELMQLRGRVTAQQVYWILPANNTAIQDMIRVLARDYHDVVLGFEPRRDKTHPTQTGYRQLARQTQ